MRIMKERTAVAALSELRTGMDAILAQLKESPVTLEKHRRAVAVLVEPARFAAMDEALESAADILLAFEARSREVPRRRGGR